MRNDGDDIIMMMMAELVVDRRKEEKRIHFHNKCHVYMILIPGILIIQFAHTHSHTTARAHATKCEHILYELPFSVIHPFSLYAISGKCVSVGFSFQFALNKAKQKKRGASFDDEKTNIFNEESAKTAQILYNSCNKCWS